MAYTYTNSKGKQYILHAQQTVLKNGTKQTIYFFSGEKGQGPRCGAGRLRSVRKPQWPARAQEKELVAAISPSGEGA